MACLAFAAPQGSSLESAANHLNKRLACASDSDCVGTHHFCSRKSNVCIKKFDAGKKCAHDDNCQTGYCGRHTDKCSAKKADNKTCFGTNSACTSGYCGIYSNKCEASSGLGDYCEADAQCRGTATCKKNVCVRKTTTPTGVTKREDADDN
ncbi:hypothetical protein CBS101457_004986 [Exobasidium rhododendri]|nr:hypothetical protein CBS101457_004986 [Exobasidium rhododendri]